MKYALLLGIIAAGLMSTWILAGCSSGGGDTSDYKPPAQSATSTQGTASNNKPAEAK